MALADVPLGAPRKKGPPCSVCLLLAALDDNDRARLEGWLSDPTIRYQAIERELRPRGYPVAAFSYSRHARGDCDLHRRYR